MFERSCEGCLRSPKFCFHCTYRYSILRHVITKPQTIGQLKRIFSETNRRRIHALIHDLEYEGIIKRDWDCLYHLRGTL